MGEVVTVIVFTPAKPKQGSSHIETKYKRKRPRVSEASLPIALLRELLLDLSLLQ